MRQVLEKSDCRSIIRLRGGKSVINPGRKDIQVFFQKDTNPSLGFIANLNISRRVLVVSYYVGITLSAKYITVNVEMLFMKHLQDVIVGVSMRFLGKFQSVSEGTRYTSSRFM